MKSRLVRIFVIINLILLSMLLTERINLFHNLFLKTLRIFFIPLVLSVFLFYIIRPLNNIFISRGIKYGRASLLSLSIFTFVLSGLLSLFSRYAYAQFRHLTRMLLQAFYNNEHIDTLLNWFNHYINTNRLYSLTTGTALGIIQQIARSIMLLAKYFMNAFSMVFLIIVLVFYMLRDGHKFKDKAVELVPSRYKKIAGEIISKGDAVLSHYVTGQAKVATSLAIMVFIGYKLIRMPNGMVLAVITFVLAFIPFVGFFISMIIPTVVSIGMGWLMVVKLAGMFIIVQTLKGRVVVPAIMAKSMGIHPITDIFLVVGAIAVGGPFAAFVIVPVYAILKETLQILIKEGKIRL